MDPLTLGSTKHVGQLTRQLSQAKSVLRGEDTTELNENDQATFLGCLLVGLGGNMGVYDIYICIYIYIGIMQGLHSLLPY